MLLSCIGFFCVLAFHTSSPNPSNITLFVSLVSCLAFPEMMLRRSWRIGLLITVLGSAAGVLSSYHSSSGSERLLQVFISVGTAVGFGAGWGTRSLFCITFGAPIGALSGYCSFFMLDWVDRLHIPGGVIPGISILIVSVLMPFAVILGFSIYFGLLFSKRSRPGSRNKS